MRRRGHGSETWHRLQDWDRGQAAAERLAGHILRQEGFGSLDPTHPLGGPDGLKDLICVRDGTEWVAAAYFPRGQKTPSSLTRKFRRDCGRVISAGASGFVFVTNQELTSAARKKLLGALSPGIGGEIFHLERIASIVDSPALYGVRLEFLDMEMTKEEQIAFIAERDEVLRRVVNEMDRVAGFLQRLDSDDVQAHEDLRRGIPLRELREFKETLASITGGGWGTAPPWLSSLSSLGSLSSRDPTIADLRVPLAELREFQSILQSIIGRCDSSGVLLTAGHMAHLRVPLEELREYEATLDRVIEKRGRLPRRSS